MKLRATLVQQSLAWHDPAANHARLQSALAPLAGETDLVVLPEMFPTGFSMQARELAEPVGGPSTQWLLRQARELDAAVTGSVITEEGGRYFNRLLWAEPSGALRQYDKRHLFRMAREHEHYSAGREALCVQWRGWRICPLVCYDLRFPVFSRRRPELEYDVLVYVANWPSVRREPWRTLLRARAIENQAFVIGVNRVGRDGNGIEYAGDSAACDFAGGTLLDLGSEARAATAELDGAALRAFRERFPAHLDADRFTLEG